MAEQEYKQGFQPSKLQRSLPDGVLVSQRLFADGKIRHYNREYVERSRRMASSQMANCKKISGLSSRIMSQEQRNWASRVLVDAATVNLEKSVYHLKEFGVLNAFESVTTLADIPPSKVSGRLRAEVRFVYQLWDAIGEAEVSAESFLQVLQCFANEDKAIPEAIRRLFKYRDEETVEGLITSWAKLVQDRLYYDCVQTYSTVQQKKRQSINDNEASSGQSMEKVYFNNKSDCSTPYEKQVKRKMFTEQKLCQSRQQRQEQEMKQCYFRPNTTNKKITEYNSPLFDRRDVVQRLYTTEHILKREEMKKQYDQERTELELKECTFKPQFIAKHCTSSRNKSVEKVNGFAKTAERLRSASKKNEERKALQERIPNGENYEKIRMQPPNPPKMLDRVKKLQPQTLFYIQFDLGKRKVKVNIKDGEKAERLAKETAKTYSLSKASELQIAAIIKEEQEKYEEMAMKYQNKQV